QFGGDCAMEHNPLANELARWQTELTTGHLFSSATAQDLMEPLAATVDHETPNATVLAALLDSGALVWPLVDREGRLVAIGSPTHEAEAAPLNGSANGNPTKLAKTIAHNATLAE